ncbi:hypothetical protein [Arthrobacter sp. UYCu712]|uniref:hypothetical protein n=1 Tax=Arthrobacter sp. UYCu712 TaxID=3156340 RepID=UPI003396BE95
MTPNPWMSRDSPAHVVERFFAKHGRANLVLPDGWYGRPFDSLFSLTLAADLQHGLKIELEGGRELVCEGDVSVAKTKFDKYPALRIEGFQAASWDPCDGIGNRQTYRGSTPVFLVS